MTVSSRRRHQFLLAGLRWLVFFFWCALGLQVFFVARIAMMRYVDPGSTAFQRSELGRLSHKYPAVRWSQQWVAQPKLPLHIQRAVIASEDDILRHIQASSGTLSSVLGAKTHVLRPEHKPKIKPLKWWAAQPSRSS